MNEHSVFKEAKAISDKTDLVIFLDYLATESNDPSIFEEIFWHFLDDKNFDVQAECLEVLMSVFKRDTPQLNSLALKNINDSSNLELRYSLRMSSLIGISEVKFNSNDIEVSQILYERYVDPNEEDGIKGSCFVALLKVYFGISTAECVRRNQGLILGATSIQKTNFEREITILRKQFK